MTLEGANKTMKSSRGVLSRDTELLERLQRIRAALVEVREELRDGVQDDIVDEPDPVADTAGAVLAADAVMAVGVEADTDAEAVEAESEFVSKAVSDDAEDRSVAADAGEKSDAAAADAGEKSDSEAADAETERDAPSGLAASDTAAEVSDAAQVKPSAAAVSPKSRTRRRRKGDEEEKELFPFYEQSLF